MNQKLTIKVIKALSNGTVFCTDQNATGITYLDKIGYYANAYGWQFDVYDYGETVLLIGYAPAFATYIEPEKVNQKVCEILQRKIDILKYRKNELMNRMNEKEGK